MAGKGKITHCTSLLVLFPFSYFLFFSFFFFFALGLGEEGRDHKFTSPHMSNVPAFDGRPPLCVPGSQSWRAANLELILTFLPTLSFFFLVSQIRASHHPRLQTASRCRWAPAMEVRDESDAEAQTPAPGARRKDPDEGLQRNEPCEKVQRLLLWPFLFYYLSRFQL